MNLKWLKAIGKKLSVAEKKIEEKYRPKIWEIEKQKDKEKKELLSAIRIEVFNEIQRILGKDYNQFKEILHKLREVEFKERDLRYSEALEEMEENIEEFLWRYIEYSFEETNWIDDEGYDFIEGEEGLGRLVEGLKNPKDKKKALLFFEKLKNP